MLYNSNKENIFIFVVVLQVTYTPNSWILSAMSLSSVHPQVAGRLQPHRTCRTTGGKTACCILDSGHCLMQAWARVQLGDPQTQPVRLGRFADNNTGRAPELSEHQQTVGTGCAYWSPQQFSVRKAEWADPNQFVRPHAFNCINHFPSCMWN